MTISRSSLAALVVMGVYMNCSASVEIELPVSEPIESNQQLSNTFRFENTTTLGSDVVWRGYSLTDKRPGWTSLNAFRWQRGNWSHHISYNLYTNASDDTPSQGPTTVTGPAGTTAQITYLMTESKIGSQFMLSDVFDSTVALTVSRVIYQWPNGSNWLWTGPECDSTNNNLLSSLSTIKPFKTTELSVEWHNYRLLFAKSDDGSKPVVSGQTQGADVQNYQAAYGKNWGDYLHIATPGYFFAPGYSVNFEVGNWDEIGRYFQANIYYPFNKTMTGVLKLFDFRGASGIDDRYGITVNLQLKHLSEVK